MTSREVLRRIRQLGGRASHRDAAGDRAGPGAMLGTEVAAAMKVIAVYRHERQPDGTTAWIVDLADEPRCHTFGRTLRAAQRNIREAAAAWYEVDPSEVEVADDVRLPAPASRAIGQCQALRAREREARHDAREATVAA